MLAAGRKFAELAGRRRRAQQQLTQPDFWPTAQGGINAITSAAMLPQTDALILTNLVPSEYGCAVRKGYVEYCEAVAAGDGIKTLVPFDPESGPGVAYPKLFACTSDGIFDVSTAGTAAAKVIDFPNKDVHAGWCSWTHYTTVAGQYIALCDESNGYYLYTAATDSWAKIVMGGGGISGVNPALFCYVVLWKSRLWFVERYSGRAWWLAVGNILGTAKSFTFGNKFKHGGYLKSLWSWTLDAGEGIDDHLIVMSSAGDMAVYKGTNPDTALDTDAFQQVGWWYVGRPTEGRRQGNSMGGDLLLLTSFGVLQTSKLVSGLAVTDEQVSISYKVNPRINNALMRNGLTHGWHIRTHPAEQLIFLISPLQPGYAPMQFVYNMATRAWCQFTGLPMKTAEVWQGRLFFGSDDNRIYTYDGHVDHFMLADDGASADSIEWESLSGFQPLGSPAAFKRLQFLRPQFITTSPPSYLIEARYDFDLTALPGSPPYTPPADTALWDSALWDTSVWSGGMVIDQPPRGAFGLGRRAAIAMRGRSAAETVHVGTDVLFDTGGLL